MANIPHTAVTLLGIPFFQGECVDAVRLAEKGGLIVAPSGPGLAQDLPRDPDYARALRTADLVLPDSGYLILLYRLCHGQRLRRLSGLIFLQACLRQWADALNTPGSSLWVMPAASEARRNREWLARCGIRVSEDACYLAPVYNRDQVEDSALLQLIKERQPRFVFINIGGGIQEKLGWWLRAQLHPAPALICTGAAIAFLSGTQAPIPRWADRLFLGWFIRVLWNPKVFLPRYLGALRLIGQVRADAGRSRGEKD